LGFTFGSPVTDDAAQVALPHFFAFDLHQVLTKTRHKIEARRVRVRVRVRVKISQNKDKRQ
jgi:hypothetical protein